MDKKPQIIIDDYRGIHNTSKDTFNRVRTSAVFKDQSTIMIIPSIRGIHPKVVQSWMNLINPMNQKFMRIFPFHMEVGEAYSHTIEMILNDPQLNNWKYILTMETDNMPPYDGIIKLLENMDRVDIVGGLYWTKGEGGQPMIYGNPAEMPMNFRPQMPLENALQSCNGLGMGFTLFKLDIFKDPKLTKPFFKTQQEGGRFYTQDLYFFEKVKALGYKVACDTRVKVGHYDEGMDVIW